MVIENGKAIKCLSISYGLHKYVCRPSLKKLPKDLDKIYQLFANIQYNSYSGKSIKI